MNPVFTGIYNLFKADTDHAFYTAIGGRFYHYSAPQDADYPYCVYGLVSGLPAPTFSEIEEELWIQFSVFSENESATEAGTIVAALYTLFDYCTLTVTGYNFISMTRDMPTLPNHDLTQDPPIHGYTAQYAVKIQKSR